MALASSNQAELCRWLCDKTGLVPTKNIKCIGSISGGIIRGVVGYDAYNGASFQVHVAGEAGWLSKQMLFAMFDYPFNVCKCNLVIAPIPSGNVDCLKFVKNLGFRVLNVIEGAHPDGALWLMVMERGECRYLMSNRNGQESRRSSNS